MIYWMAELNYNWIWMIFYEKDTSFEMTIARIHIYTFIEDNSMDRHFEGCVHDHFLFGSQKKWQKLSIVSKTLSLNLRKI